MIQSRDELSPKRALLLRFCATAVLTLILVDPQKVPGQEAGVIQRPGRQTEPVGRGWGQEGQHGRVNGHVADPEQPEVGGRVSQLLQLGEAHAVDVRSVDVGGQSVDLFARVSPARVRGSGGAPQGDAPVGAETPVNIFRCILT